LFSTTFSEQLESSDVVGGDYSSFDPLFDRAWKTLEEKYSKVRTPFGEISAIKH
jgi:hypothetical protein